MIEKFRAKELSIEFYAQCESITKRLNLKGEISSQLMRAALSISLNLSEGSARVSVKERKRFFLISYGSYKECQTLLEILKQNSMIQSFDILGAYLYKLSH